MSQLEKARAEIKSNRVKQFCDSVVIEWLKKMELQFGYKPHDYMLSCLLHFPNSYNG